MGNRFGRGQGEGEEFAYRRNNNGMYFGDHFVMGGEEFAALDPEAFLFGDMSDLNYLPNAPGAIRVPPNFAHTNTTRCLFFTNKESLKLVPVGGSAAAAGADTGNNDEGGAAVPKEYTLEFAFDADAPCVVTVQFFCKETVAADGTVDIESKRAWPPQRFEAGLHQVYSLPNNTINLGDFASDDLFFHLVESRTYPLVISIESLEHGARHAVHTYGAFERNAGGTLGVRQIVQKVTVNEVCLVLKEIFGIEREADGAEDSGGAAETPDDLDEDNTECVVCMSSPKDTMVLPCRHMCLCNSCAEVLRFQANKCPICRASYHSLLQIRVLQPKAEDGVAEDDDDDDDEAVNPPGFSSIALSMAVDTSTHAQQRPAAAAEFAERAELGMEGGVSMEGAAAGAVSAHANDTDDVRLPPAASAAVVSASDSLGGEEEDDDEDLPPSPHGASGSGSGEAGPLGDEYLSVEAEAT